MSAINLNVLTVTGKMYQQNQTKKFELVIKNNGEANWLLATLYFNAIEIKVLGGLKHKCVKSV